MKLALYQARKNLGNTKENPSVGCVIVKDNQIISVGSTSINGRPHAEQNAFNFAKVNVENSNAYVTLEPCNHYGKTPPCTKKIIKKKIKKVFFSIDDPDHRVHKKSSKLFNSSGILVSKGLLKNEIKFFYRSYIKFKKKNLPFVTCKLAVSKDLFTINKKKKRWITNKFSRGRVHLMRANHDCLITSSATIIKDNPLLTCRIKGLEKRTPTRIILDRKLKIPLNSRILQDTFKYKTIIFYNKINKEKIKLLKKIRVKTIQISLNEYGQINIPEDIKQKLIQRYQLAYNLITS